jgi:hypothetical protein
MVNGSALGLGLGGVFLIIVSLLLFRTNLWTLGFFSLLIGLAMATAGLAFWLTGIGE